MTAEPLERTPTSLKPLRIGTRGSALALAQANEVRDRLAEAHGLPTEAFEIVTIRTTGDQIIDRSLRELGGKGLFTREIEQTLSDGSIDIAVHSMKDMPVLQPEGLVIDCILPRQDPRDAFVSERYASLTDLPEGAVVGTSSLRRHAQVRLRRPDLRVVEFRGNVQTRLTKLADGVADATFLAMAGLRRLGLSHIATCPVDAAEMLPAVAQGAIGVERRAADDLVAALLAAINDPGSALRVTAERAFLRRLDGSCETPIAGLADLLPDGSLILRGQILRPDGSEALGGERHCPASDAEAMGEDLAANLLGRAGPGFLDFKTAAKSAP